MHENHGCVLLTLVEIGQVYCVEPLNIKKGFGFHLLVVYAILLTWVPGTYFQGEIVMENVVVWERVASSTCILISDGDAVRKRMKNKIAAAMPGMTMNNEQKQPQEKFPMTIRLDGTLLIDQKYIYHYKHFLCGGDELKVQWMGKV